MTHSNDISAFEKLFLALSDPTRLRLLALMTNGPVSVGYLASQLGESQPKISRHLAYLRNAELVSTAREGKWVYYQLAEQQDAGIERVLMSTMKCITGSEQKLPAVSVKVISEDREIANDASAGTYMTEWAPNELEIHLL